MLTEDEWQKREENEGKLLLTREDWLKRSYKRNTYGSSNYKGRGGRDKSNLKCYNCSAYGHFAADCRKPRRVKEHKEEVNMTKFEDDEPALLLAKCDDSSVTRLSEKQVVPSQMTKVQSDSNVWYLDNGASSHMTGFKSKFTELNEQISGQVSFGDGSTVRIEGKGYVAFVCKNGEVRMLNDVYYIPTLRNNIISLGQLTEEGNKITIKGDLLWVYDTQDRLLMKVKRSQNRLYKLIINTATPKCMLLKQNEVSKLWHMHLGHVNYHALSLMLKDNMVNGMPKVTQPNEVCTGCLMSKQTRKQFPSKTSYNANKVLELVHGDLCGPILPETTSGKRYFFLLVDDYSRYMWVYFLHSKDEALTAFKNFCVLVEREPDRMVRVFRTDRGGEFGSNDFKTFCEENGIKRHYTAPYTPQQNGVVERRNRTVVEMARSCLKEMKLPCMLWGEAVRHSIYLLNRLPTRALTGQTPYEAWNEKKPHVGHTRIFGCVAHMKIPSQQTNKLDDRSKQVINLGKESGTKAYRLYDPNSNKIHVSRDVTFEERRSWPWNDNKDKQDVQAGTFTIASAIVTEEREHQSNTGMSSNESENMYTPISISHVSKLNSEDYDESTEPRRIKKIGEIYNEIEEVQLEEELFLMGIEEPINFKQAAKDHNWKMAMEREMQSIEENNTWKLSELPPGKKTIGLKWIFKLKKDAEGKVLKHKARLVAKGYVQEHGVDFDEIFAPVTRLETVRLLLALAAKSEWEVHHLDVKTAFLNGEISEDVYVAQPEGFEKEGKKNLVYKLLKALYGLRQAPRAWYAKLNSCLESLGFKRCPSEHAVYTRKEGENNLIVAVYVDDLLVTGNNVSDIDRFKEQMSQRFDMTDMGMLNYYLGIEVEQSKGCIKLKQSGYARKIIEKAGLKGCNPTKYPMDPKEQIDKDKGGKVVDITQYKIMIGGLRYLVHTRPDIAYSVGIASRYM